MPTGCLTSSVHTAREERHWVRALTPWDSAWVEEPTSPDDDLGHAAIRAAVAPVPVATGEHVQNGVVAKQLLRAGASDVDIRDWRIWRDGQDVFHLLDVDDYAAMPAELREHPANVAWQARVRPLQEVPDDYSGQDTGLRLVWSFIHQLASRTSPDQSPDAGRGRT